MPSCMKTYQKIIATGLMIAGLSGLVSCDKRGLSEQEINKIAYFASVPMGQEAGVAMTSGDFDGDGDLDLVVATRPFTFIDQPLEGRLYYFKNDGKGNFSQ